MALVPLLVAVAWLAVIAIVAGVCASAAAGDRALRGPMAPAQRRRPRAAGGGRSV